jgi:RNA polymerase sigma-70 factor, ECF subfamily
MEVSDDPAALAALIFAAGIEAFGELEVDPAVVARAIDDALADGVAAAQLAQLAAEVYLGAACGAGRPAAAAIVERVYIARVDQVIAGKRLPRHGVDEVRQTVRERLLAGAPPYVARVVGRGALASLVAVIATRAAIDWLRVAARGTARHAEAAEAELLIAVDDPARDHLRTRYRAEIKAAFEAAVVELDPRERTLLRLHLVERVTIDELAVLYQIHRATAARQIERARERIASATRQRLARATALGGDELRELAALVASQLDLSLSRVLSGDADPA